MKSKVLRGC
jgi:hypothetical protein